MVMSLTGRCWRSSLASAVLVLLYLALPSDAAAQSIAGAVRDASGGVLPGVTVEASSPALIERVRSTITDGSGQYRLENLAPGVYSVSYALPGFTTVVREGVQLQSGVTVSINADMRVGGVQETITVTGETPVVDVRTSTRVQQVIDDEVISVLPASRGYGNLLQTVAGIQATGAANSGANPVMNFFTSRGGRSNEGTVQIDGMNVGSAFNGGGVSSYGYDTANSQEVQITVSGGMGETDRGGPQFNLVPKTGGNTFSGTYFGSTAGRWSQGDNLDDELRAFGINELPAIIKNWDTSIALGGPIMRDRLWFFGVVRTFGNHNDVAGVYANANAGDPAAWNYVADRGVKARLAEDKKIAGVRLTSQLTARHKVSAFWDYQKACQGGSFREGGGDQCRGRGDDWVAIGAFGSWSPESSHIWDDRERIQQYSWTSPVTNRLLLEAGYSQFLSNWGGQTPAGALDAAPFIPVTEQSTLAGTPLNNFVYHGFAGLGNNYQSHNVWRASVAYVTGSHSLKVGHQGAYEVTNSFGNFPTHGLAYRFNNGVPNQLTQRITPWQQGNRTRYDGLYVQDQWTRGRATVQAALRYEHAWSFFPEGKSGLLQDSVFGGRAYTLPAADGVKGYHDIAPRMGLAYDVFGNGKTAVKVNLSKYWQSANNEGNYTTANPAATFAQTTSRSWTDGNRNFIPDCDLQNRGPAGQPGDGRGSLRRLGQPELRLAGQRHHPQPGRPRGMGRSSVRLAVRPVAAAGAAAARVGRSRLQPAVVGQLLLHRESGSRAPGLRHADLHRPDPSESPHQRAAGLVHADQGVGVRQGRQLLHVRERLRRRGLLLARRGSDRERPDQQRADDAGRLQHGRRRPRHLRDHRQAAGDPGRPAGRLVRRQ